MNVSFRYDLTSTGWAEATVSDGIQCRSMTVSYLSDALGDMTKAILHLLQGSRRETVSFLDEPGEHVWTLQSQDHENLTVEVAWFEDWLEADAPQGGREVFAASCKLRDFANEVRAALDQLLDKYGLEGYEQRWVEHGFPVAEHARLEKALVSNPRTVKERDRCSQLSLRAS